MLLRSWRIHHGCSAVRKRVVTLFAPHDTQKTGHHRRSQMYGMGIRPRDCTAFPLGTNAIATLRGHRAGIRRRVGGEGSSVNLVLTAVQIGDNSA